MSSFLFLMIISAVYCRRKNDTNATEGVLHYVVNFKDSNAMTCSGMIFDESTVFTSCNCVIQKDEDTIQVLGTDSLTILAGSKGIQNATQVRNVDQFQVYRRCKKLTSLLWISNLAFVKLSSPFNLDAKVKAAPVKTDDIQTIVNDLLYSIWKQKCSTVIWENSTQIVIDVNVTRYNDCKGVTCDANEELCLRDQKEYVCVLPRNPKRKICHANLGSPLICNKYVWGLMGYKPDCNTKTPGLFSVFVANIGFFTNDSNRLFLNCILSLGTFYLLF